MGPKEGEVKGGGGVRSQSLVGQERHLTVLSRQLNTKILMLEDLTTPALYRVSSGC